MRTIHGNLVRFTSLCLVAAAGTVAASAHAQTFLQRPNVVSAPTLEQCTLANQGFQPGTPRNVVMMGQYPLGCSKVLADEMARRTATQPATVRPMYRADASAWPANLASTTPVNLIQGLFNSFVEGDVRVKYNDDLSYGGTLLAHSVPAGASLLNTRTAEQAVQHRAHVDWQSRGTALMDWDNPCGEWVWKGYYDYSRFEDSAMSCGTDDECVYQVAYSSTSLAPGIAFRSSLKSMDAYGRYFRPNFTIPLMRGFRMKNAYFGADPAFLVDQQAGLLDDLQRMKMVQAVLFDGKSLELQAGPKNYSCAGNFRFRDPTSKYFVDGTDGASATKLANLNADISAIRGLLRQKAGYLISPTSEQSAAYPQAERFANEWYYHKAMHDRQKPTGGTQGQPLSQAERRAIDERTKTLLDLIERYTVLTSPRFYGNRELPVEVGSLNPIDEALSRVVNPIDQGVGFVDPFLRETLISSMRKDLVEPRRVASLEASGNVVTNQLVVPFSLDRRMDSATPYSNPRVDTNARAGSTLLGVEVDYGKAAEVERAKVGPRWTCPDPAEENDNTTDIFDLARAAQKVQEQIVELLVDEYRRGDQGCLSATGYNCDWSQKIFAQRFMGQFAEKREEAFQYCVAMTGGNTLNHPDPLLNVPQTSRKMDSFPVHLQSVADELRAQLNGMPYVNLGGTDHRMGESLEGGKELWDKKWFGGGYDYAANWSVLPRFADNAEPNTSACAFEGDVGARFDGAASMLGKRIEIMHASAEGHARAAGSQFNFDLEFLGETFHPGGTSEHFQTSVNDSLESQRASATVVVVVVPVTFQAFGELQYGYELEAVTEANNECGQASPSPRMGLTVRLEPYVKANAVASAAVGVSGAQAGVRGRINLLDARLPVKAGMDVRSETGAIKLFPTASADLELSTLGGSMSVFAEVGYSFASYTAEKEIFSWRGLQDTRPIWQLESDPVYLAAFSKGAWEQWKETNAAVAPVTP